MPTCASIIEFFVHVSGEAVAATIGAFFGAGAAFLLQHSNEKKRREDEQYAAAVQAQHALLFMWRILASMKKSYLDKERTAEDRHRKLATYWKTDLYLKIDLNSIAFLFGPGRRTVMANCFFAERSYVNAMDAVEERNEALAAIFANAEGVADAQIGLMFVKDAPNSPRDVFLRKATDALYNTTDRALALCAMAFGDLRMSALAALPGRHFLKEENLTEEYLEKEMEKLGVPFPKKPGP